MISILIPTCKTRDETAPQICLLEGYSDGCEIYASCINKSASVNRNNCLDNTAGETIIFIDDDISGFYDGWVSDMIAPLNDPNIIITSARLIKTDGSVGVMMYKGNPDIDGVSEVPRVPTAAIAFRRNNIRFFEGYLGSGFEDDHFIAEMQELFPGKRIVINNKCKLIHLNEQKNQGEHYAENKALFHSIWEESLDGSKRTRKNKYHAEYGEDKFVNEIIFHNKKNGVFFEAGAIDGITCSNSLFFEKALGWTGLCVEANPARFAELKRNRTCQVDNRGLWESECKKEFLAVEGGLTGWGGIVDAIEPEHSERIEKNISKSSRYNVQVSCTTIEKMLIDHNLKKIDFLTLDIEGAEFTVLKKFPFREFDIDTWCIENNYGTYPIELLMNENHYVKVGESGVSEFYRRGGPGKVPAEKNTDGYWGIPKILHFVWIGSEMPSWAKANIAEFQRLNPDFTIRIHGEEGLAPIFAGRYALITDQEHALSMKSDLIRVSRLMNEGGWYWDCDFWPLVSIREMCARMDLSGGRMPLFSSWDNEVVANGVLACRKDDLGVKALFELLLTRGYPKPNWWDYGTWCTWKLLKDKPELYTRVDWSFALPCYNKDGETYRKNVMKIMATPERIKEVKDAGGWAIHFAQQGKRDWL
jgi:FkbM family methyltransferase